MMEYFGDHDGYIENSVNIDLMLMNIMETAGVYFEMFVPKGNIKLIAGTYSYDEDSYEPFTFSYGSVSDGLEMGIDVTSGTLTVGVSGSTYTIEVNCKLENGGTVKGTYEGSLIWNDMTEEEY